MMSKQPPRSSEAALPLPLIPSSLTTYWEGLSSSNTDLRASRLQKGVMVYHQAVRIQIKPSRERFQTPATPTCNRASISHYKTVLLLVSSIVHKREIRCGNGESSTRHREESDVACANRNPLPNPAKCHISPGPPRPHHHMLTDVRCLPLRSGSNLVECRS